MLVNIVNSLVRKKVYLLLLSVKNQVMETNSVPCRICKKYIAPTIKSYYKISH